MLSNGNRDKGARGAAEADFEIQSRVRKVPLYERVKAEKVIKEGLEENGIKNVELKFSYTEQLDVLLELLMNLDGSVCGQPPGVNMRKHMNINENADEKGATVLSELFLDK